MLRTFILCSIVCLLLNWIAISADAAEESKDTDAIQDKERHGWLDPTLFHDEKDGQFDISNFLASRHGFLPVPILITGPTLGAGGGLNLMFLHGGLTGTVAPNGRHVPPTITGVAAAATENGSKIAGAYNLGFWFDDRLRTTTAVGRPDVNLDFYPNIDGREYTVDVNLEGWSFYEEAKLRLGKSDFLLGANYLYLKLDASFENQALPQVEDLINGNYALSGLAAVLEYDSRDTIFTPTRGMYGKLVARTYADWLGSDDDFMAYSGKVFKYLHLFDDFDLALRVQGDTVGSDAPFFIYPSVQIRGIANKRYQGQHVAVGEAELNWRVYQRWHLIGFIGTGKAFGKNKLRQKVDFSDADWRSSKGIGFRYEIARKFGMQVGADVAWGPEDTAFYITVGSAWNSFF
ncbi:glyceraldehyde-3-phosphate dehydrogenase [Desulfosarcina widdelii]|uniref:Glyceraldehyde-3-phosphate dehydrogenase n=1 Tax=Desulfosarcina widdelii TaxID=947919 RepID=A0A5K7Z952_9BACT|nr:BamA/TamA family outer membrane protein [Desulfosarcina widdelii]BBO78552.1 glyceraldehyde-3-phosphate dehydrogenase [Desulfosarcina widdelii]